MLGCQRPTEMAIEISAMSQPSTFHKDRKARWHPQQMSFLTSVPAAHTVFQTSRNLPATLLRAGLADIAAMSRFRTTSVASSADVITSSRGTATYFPPLYIRLLVDVTKRVALQLFLNSYDNLRTFSRRILPENIAKRRSSDFQLSITLKPGGVLPRG